MKNTQMIGPYRLYRTIGEGAFAKVRLGLHTVINQKVAAKILQKSNIRNKELDEKVRREIRFSKYFRHPNIIHLYEVIETPNEIIMIMEYAQGGELFDLICREMMEEQQARRIFQQIIFGVEYLHTHQVSHRDLKPENILLDADNNVKLADFGLSNIMKDGIFLYSSCGSPNYAAPELISGKYYNGASIDIWSCGVILYTLLTGCLPFNEKTTSRLYKKIRDCSYRMPENVPEAAKDLIYRMLQKDPLDRISIAEIKQHSWFTGDLNLFQIIDNHRYIYGSRTQLNKDVIHEMFLNEKILAQGLTEDELIKKISSKERKDLCTIYEFVENNRNERLFKEKSKKLNNNVNFFKRIQINKTTENFLNKLKNKMRLKFEKNIGGEKEKYKEKEKEKEEEKNMDLDKSLDKMNIDEEIELKKKENQDSSNNNNNTTTKKEDLWRVGIVCKKECFALTQEILKILEKNGYEWKIISSSYKIKCRKKQNDDSKNLSSSSTLPETSPLNILIQIFGDVDPQQKDEFLVDLHKLSGPVMEFLEFSSIFISAIQKLGIIVMK